MISRRRLLFFLSLVGFTIPQTACAQSQTEEQAKATDESLPPHCAALALVWNTQANLIKEIEIQRARVEVVKQKESIGAEGRWWFDLDERDWKVARPFAPGQIDSTHMFTVTYVINGNKLLSWSVDTRKKNVTVISK